MMIPLVDAFTVKLVAVMPVESVIDTAVSAVPSTEKLPRFSVFILVIWSATPPLIVESMFESIARLLKLMLLLASSVRYCILAPIVDFTVMF